jgi:hypothetical protein
LVPINTTIGQLNTTALGNAQEVISFLQSVRKRVTTGDLGSSRKIFCTGALRMISVTGTDGAIDTTLSTVRVESTVETEIGWDSMNFQAKLKRKKCYRVAKGYWR